jgi:CxxC motif-containing protein (DUF1111 family)
MKSSVGHTLPFVVGLAASLACTQHDSREFSQTTSATQGITTFHPNVADPGPRGGSAAAGSFFAGLGAAEQAVFTQALGRFQEVDSVSGGLPGESGVGLGPTFNGNSCAMCHAQPAVGGSSPGLTSPQNPVPNPQVALATLDGAENTVPPFITPDGPVREARFISTGTDPSAPLDGGVHGLFTIQGRSDAPGCALAQPDFATALANGNVIFRIPTPLFGLGLVENTPDSALQANLAADAARKGALGIGGRFNTSGNDGTITRFGWKAQNKSLLIFAGEAYNVEQGVSNEAFPNERSAAPGCVFNSTPEDSSNFTNPNGGGATGTVSEMSSDVVNFALFARLSAPPTPATPTRSAQHGAEVFDRIGCTLCHSPSLTTAASPFTGMGNFTYHPYSDFAIHHMGGNLADGISQGAATADEFRTAPLWGLGQRLFFLHDGRTSDLVDAIEEHASDGRDRVTSASFEQFSANGQVFVPFASTTSNGSEADAVVSAFNGLSNEDQRDLIAFLRSL